MAPACVCLVRGGGASPQASPAGPQGSFCMLCVMQNHLVQAFANSGNAIKPVSFIRDLRSEWILAPACRLHSGCWAWRGTGHPKTSGPMTGCVGLAAYTDGQWAVDAVVGVWGQVSMSERAMGVG